MGAPVTKRGERYPPEAVRVVVRDEARCLRSARSPAASTTCSKLSRRNKDAEITGEQNEVEGQAKRFHEPAKDVEGQGVRYERSDTESPEEKAEEKGDESRNTDDELEVEGQAKRFHDKS